jgi:hypothetical protein
MFVTMPSCTASRISREKEDIHFRLGARWIRQLGASIFWFLENLNGGGAPDLSNTMATQTETLALTIKFWTLVAVCCYYGGIPFLWKFGFIMALIDWFVGSYGYINNAEHI